MSVKLVAWAWDSNIPTTDKMVLLCLCDFANDEGGCWPSVSTLVRKTGLAERSVQNAIKRLCTMGILTRLERSGTSTHYQIHPRTTCTPAADAPPHLTTDTPAPRAPHPRTTCTLTINEPSRTTKRDSADAEHLTVHGVVGNWNEVASKIGKPKVVAITPVRKKAVQARIAQFSRDDFVKVFGNIEASSFLRDWPAFGFDWCMKAGNFLKILEGNYEDKSNGRRNEPSGIGRTAEAAFRAFPELAGGYGGAATSSTGDHGAATDGLPRPLRAIGHDTG